MHKVLIATAAALLAAAPTVASAQLVIPGSNGSTIVVPAPGQNRGAARPAPQGQPPQAQQPQAQQSQEGRRDQGAREHRR